MKQKKVKELHLKKNEQVSRRKIEQMHTRRSHETVVM